MNDRASDAASAIARILEGLDDDELAATFEALKRRGIRFNQVRPKAIQSEARPRKDATGAGERPVQSKAVASLKDADPAKYEVLDEFEKLLRNYSLFKETSSLRDFALRLDKSFPKVKARRELISKLMALLASRRLPELQRLVAESVPASQRSQDDYRKLAEFIIRGTGDR